MQKDEIRERMIKLIQSSVDGCSAYWAGRIADGLLDNDVTFSEDNKWIPVSDPPKTSGVYQIFGYDKDWEKTKVWYEQFYGCNWFVCDIYGDGKRFEVTHWMPLPQAPSINTKEAE